MPIWIYTAFSYLTRCSKVHKIFTTFNTNTTKIAITKHLRYTSITQYHEFEVSYRKYNWKQFSCSWPTRSNKIMHPLCEGNLYLVEFDFSLPFQTVLRKFQTKKNQKFTMPVAKCIYFSLKNACLPIVTQIKNNSSTAV